MQQLKVADWRSDHAARTERALQLGDPMKLFRTFTDQPANVDRQVRVKDTQTFWAHGHFYSPVVSRAEAEREWPRLVRPRVPAGVDLREAEQRAMLGRLMGHFETAPFQNSKTEGQRYYYDNPSYHYGDATVYWSMLNVLRPSRIIEIGSGYSSALALDTIDLLGLPTRCSFIDPFPAVAEAATAPLGADHDVRPYRVQDLDLAILDELNANDILFIDSSHVVKTGSDVHFELTEMLPRLKPGVVVHFHDIFFPFEYPRRWVIEHNPSWNEIYFLHAFLMYNTQFRIEFWNHYASLRFASEIAAAVPRTAQRFFLNPGGGLWLRKE